MQDWIKCESYDDLPDGQWLVRVDSERSPFHVAYVSANDRGSRLVIVGNYFSWDAKTIIEYKSII